MSKDVILNKVENIKNCIERIESKKPFSPQELKANFDLQDIISVNLQRAIQSSVDLANHICSENNLGVPKDMAGVFEILVTKNILSEKLGNELIKSVGLRNVLVHEYDGIDWGIVFIVTENRLQTFRDFCGAIVQLIS
ncbi:MAG TPA: DUF86 domain-containing protein [Pseudobdellovibrionaceae bacterium]|jgi:uncharacterized protein YutE (UPF0331/DUF86 family)